MKIDDHLIVLNGQAANKARPPQRTSKSPGGDHAGVILLISQENQRAWRLNPQSLSEAKKLLDRVQSQLAKLPEDSLANTHHLDDRCLIRLP